MSTSLIFTPDSAITIATNTFIRVPIILRYEDIDLISFVKDLIVGYTPKIPIYHNDGTLLAVSVNSRIFKTKEGEKAGVTIENRPQLQVCKLDGREIFEIHQQRGDSFKMFAELHTNDGHFVKADDNIFSNIINADGTSLKIGGLTMRGCTISDSPVGIYFDRNGSFSI